MANKRKTANPPAPELIERIVQAALAHPELGARRLASALKSEGAKLSERTVRAVLRQHQLHRKELRLKALEERFPSMAPAPTGEQLKAIPSFDPCLRENEPGLDGYPTPGRSPLDLFRSAPSIGPVIESPPVPPEPAPVETPRPRPASPVSPRAPARRRPTVGAAGAPAAERWAFNVMNSMLGLLVLYLGWTVGAQILDLRDSAAGGAAQPAMAVVPEPMPAQTAEPPLPVYRVVWDRNLFGTSAPREATQEKFDLDQIAVAGSDIGLKLIGTAVGKDPSRNYAIIETLSTRYQVMYQERDRVGKALIRAILRNNVILENEDGSRRRLSVDEEPGKRGRAADQAAAPAAELPPLAEVPDVFQVSRARVPSSPEAIHDMVEELNLTPQSEDGNLEGFSVGRLRANDVLWQAGIRTGDVIKGVDDEPFRSPQDLEYFFHRLARGGEVSIMTERRGQPVLLKVTIE